MATEHAFCLSPQLYSQIRCANALTRLCIDASDDLLGLPSRMLQPFIFGEHHCDTIHTAQKLLNDCKSVQDIIATLGKDKISKESMLTFVGISKAPRFLSQRCYQKDAFADLVDLIERFDDKHALERQFDALVLRLDALLRVSALRTGLLGALAF